MKRTDIDALARLLDGDVVEETTTSADTRALAALAVALESSTAPHATSAAAPGSASTSGAPSATATLPRPEFRAELRASLIEAAREQQAHPPLLTRLRQRLDDTTNRWRYSTRVAAATGAAAMALSSGGVAVAAYHALPNEPLYGVRLTLDDASLLLILDPVARAEQRLAHATERLDDAEAVALQGDFTAAVRALEEADATARDAARELITVARERQDPAVLEPLAEWTEEQRLRLDELAPIFGGAARLSLEDVLLGISRISARLDVLSACGQCAGIEGLEVIPAADQPFNACPCVDAPTGTAKGQADGDSDGSRNAGDRKRGDNKKATGGSGTSTATTGGTGATSDGGTSTTTGDDPIATLPGTDTAGTTGAPTSGDSTTSGATVTGGSTVTSGGTATSGGTSTIEDTAEDLENTVDDVIKDVTQPKPTPDENTSSTPLPDVDAEDPLDL